VSRTLIRGGRVVTASDEVVADVLVDGDRIVQIGHGLAADGADVVDAAGLYVLPGGVDPHTHVQTGDGELDTCDGFTTGTVSAAFGGTTTIVDFCFQQRGQTFEDALATWHERLASAPPVVDVGFHLVVTDLDAGGPLEPVLDGGVTSLKLFMAYRDALMIDDGEIYRVMRLAADNGALVLVHAESGDLIETLVADALAGGRVEPRHHTLTRPPAAEAEATHRIVELARLAACPLYVVHVSCGDAAAHVGRAREAGLPVWGETCPQYLFVDEETATDPALDWAHAAQFVYSPPPRPRSEQDALWRALATDTLSVVSTDHNPFRLAQKTVATDFGAIPNGVPGVETRLQLLHELGVRRGRFGLSRLVELTATNPAKLFGLYPRKGTIAPGADADIVLFDPAATATISASSQHTNADFTLFEGTSVRGAPHAVYVRGRLVVDDGRLVAEPGTGAFVARARFGQTLHAPAPVAA